MGFKARVGSEDFRKNSQQDVYKEQIVCQSSDGL